MAIALGLTVMILAVAILTGFKKEITDITRGKFVRLFADIRDHSFFDFLSSNIIAEIVWVKEQDHEIFAGLKYLNPTELDKILKA